MRDPKSKPSKRCCNISGGFLKALRSLGNAKYHSTESALILVIFLFLVINSLHILRVTRVRQDPKLFVQSIQGSQILPENPVTNSGRLPRGRKLLLN